ncbi:MAG: HEPN domain-containing protein [Victivallales bacterium]|nr:HEPN domain-containing protein [Victivallales bacterium]
MKITAMKESLSHLPERKRDELKKLREIITEMIDADFVILFGSYARGDWVEDRNIGEDGNVYEYRSDYDILIVVRNPRKYEYANYPQRIERRARHEGVRTDLSMIFHNPAEFKRAVNKGKYFFVDIVNEGVLLHASGRVPLPEVQELSIKEQKYYAQKDFNSWFRSAKNFYGAFESELGKRHNKEAAFLLHQAAERFYVTVLLTLTGYKPKLHDLEKLDGRAQALCAEFKSIFPRGTQKERNLFDLLKRAYVDARYIMSYKITKAELDALAARVELLKALTEKVCKEKIASLTD